MALTLEVNIMTFFAFVKVVLLGTNFEEAVHYTPNEWKSGDDKDDWKDDDYVEHQEHGEEVKKEEHEEADN